MHSSDLCIFDVGPRWCIGALEEYSSLPMNKIYVGEIHGVRRQFKLAVGLADTHSAFVMVWLRNRCSAAQVPGGLETEPIAARGSPASVHAGLLHAVFLVSLGHFYPSFEVF